MKLRTRVPWNSEVRISDWGNRTMSRLQNDVKLSENCNVVQEPA